MGHFLRTGIKIATTSFLLGISMLTQANCSDANGLKSGDYASNEYISVITSTCSPAKAAKSDLPQSVKVSPKNSGYTLQVIYAFSEAGPVYFIENGHSPKLIEGVGPNPSFTRRDSTEIEFGFANHASRRFRFVNDVGGFVIKRCLEGNYIGTKNERAYFSEKGDFKIGKAVNKIAIGLNYPPAFVMDYFIQGSVEYGFSRTGDTLKIYEVQGGSLFEDGTMSPTPKMTLLRQSK
jgi:hypothetical protein